MNSSRQDDTELGRLMHDFYCKDASDIHSEILAKRVYELKETQEGVDIMCREMDQIYKEGAKLGEERGRVQGIAEGLVAGEMKAKREAAYELRDEDHFSDEKIAKRLKISLEIVQKWFAERAALAK